MSKDDGTKAAWVVSWGDKTGGGSACFVGSLRWCVEAASLVDISYGRPLNWKREHFPAGTLVHDAQKMARWLRKGGTRFGVLADFRVEL